MPFSALHTIELQLCMQCCALTDLLRLARCNRTALQAASAEFAFRCAPLIELCPLQPNLSVIFKKSLVRFSPRLSLRMLRSTVAADALHKASMALLKSAPPLYALDCLSMPYLLLDLLLSAPSLRSIRVLSLRSDLPFDGSAIKALTHVRELTVQCGPHWRILESLSALSNLTNLTVELTTADGQEPLPPAACTAIGECVSLRSLSIRNILASQIQLILSPRMKSLSSLTILDLRLTNPLLMQFEPPSWCACLSSPPQLRRVEFVRCSTLRKLLHHLTAALDPQGPLREVLFHPKPGTISGAGPHFIVDFLQRFVLLNSVQLELPRIVPHPPTLSQASYPSFALRSREHNVDRYVSRDLVEATRNAMRMQLQELLTGDERVSIVECAAAVPREEADRALMDKYAPKQRGCCIA